MKQTYSLDGKVVFVTGGTGSWGHELVRQIIDRYPKVKEVRIYSRGEHKQVEMKEEFQNSPKIKFIIGDVRDKNILRLSMLGSHVLFHLAALKHVPVCENNPWEAVLTNIYGAQNVIETAIENKIEKVIDVSTDKAVEPLNIYGITKACGEKLMINANVNYSHINSHKTKFICIRGGNVLGTNGSVIPLFKKQLQLHNEITITDPTMTRFLMNTKEAIGLIFTSIEQSVGGETFVMNMPAATIETIASVMIKLFGNKGSRIKVIGGRPGEKKHEVLISKNESDSAYVFSEKCYVLLPQLNKKELLRFYGKNKKFVGDEFSSKTTTRLNNYDFEKLLKKESWLFQ